MNVSDQKILCILTTSYCTLYFDVQITFHHISFGILFVNKHTHTHTHMTTFFFIAINLSRKQIPQIKYSEYSYTGTPKKKFSRFISIITWCNKKKTIHIMKPTYHHHHDNVMISGMDQKFYNKK